MLHNYKAPDNNFKLRMGKRGNGAKTILDQRSNSRKCIEAVYLSRKAIENHEDYFSNGYLNSEGMKALKIISRIIAEHCPEYMVYVKKARYTRTYENFLKLVQAIEGYS